MKFGVCTQANPENVAKIKACGADYIEVGFRDIMKFTPDEAKEIRKAFDDGGVGILAANCMLDGDIPIVVKEPNLALLRERLLKSFEIGSILGLETVVLGSGGARNIREGYTKEESTAYFTDVLKNFIAPFFNEYKMTCVIEPLCLRDSTLINSLADGFAVVEAVADPAIMLLGDLFHMDVENDAIENLLKYEGYMKHLHIANAAGNRCFPAKGDGQEEHYKKFMDTLRKIGYNEKMSIEATPQGEFYACATDAISLLRSL